MTGPTEHPDGVQDTVGTFKGRPLETPTDRAWIIPVVWIVCCFVCFTVGAGLIAALYRDQSRIEATSCPW